MHIAGDTIECVHSLERPRGPTERHILLIPKAFSNMALSHLLSQNQEEEIDDLLNIPVYYPTAKANVQITP